ncbi:hypothetical protein H0A36_19450 [Endozoicomonas sp. SM1973]|uniref:Uncharacterized protein n=1 Tax=Spartinivicinus marinus TaxID=2994442 RepID=A0A853ICB3_9GAMM|nr:hypothetical protein [Spartinivicinus marinus]MCX4027557.1 hypothetical protein [Spartinivicinus marinus]NYZ68198.1 hypothetical protein [Spartinivicinus marinus]
MDELLGFSFLLVAMSQSMASLQSSSAEMGLFNLVAIFMLAVGGGVLWFARTHSK